MAMINKGETFTTPDGKPYCKCTEDIQASDPLFVLCDRIGDYEPGCDPVRPFTLITEVPFIRQAGRGYQFCVNGVWR